MPFKKPPQNLDHLTRRFGPSKKDRERQARRAASGATEEGAAVESDEAQKAENLPGSERTSEPGPALTVVPKEEPAESPRPSEETPDPVPEPKEVIAPSVEATADRGKPGPASAPRKGGSAAVEVPDEQSTKIRGYVHAPLPGASDEFDKLVGAYGEQGAMRLAIATGLEDLDRKLIAGDPVEPMLDYSSKKERRRIQRKLSVEAADRATRHLDPLGVLPQYAFGTRLWKTALGLYLAKG